MKRSILFLVVCGFMTSGLLGGLAATLLAPATAQAAPLAAFGPQVVVTTMHVPSLSANNFTNTWTKIGDIGNFVVHNSTSLVEVTYQGRLYVQTMPATGTYFRLMVDDYGPTPDSGMAVIRSEEIVDSIPLTFSGYWQNLPEGQYAVSMWVRAVTGSGTYAIINPGAWESTDVIVKEYLPLGSTYLPLMKK